MALMVSTTIGTRSRGKMSRTRPKGEWEGCPSQSLDGPSADEDADGSRHCCYERAGAEDDEHQPFVAVEVPEAAQNHRSGGGGQQKRTQHPGHGGGRRVQLSSQVGQRRHNHRLQEGEGQNCCQQSSEGQSGTGRRRHQSCAAQSACSGTTWCRTPGPIEVRCSSRLRGRRAGWARWVPNRPAGG